MKIFLLFLCGGLLAMTPSARAITITIDSVQTDSDTLAFDVVWGSAVTPPLSTSSASGLGDVVFASDGGGFVLVDIASSLRFSPSTVWIFLAARDVPAGSPFVGGVPPSSVAATPDGFGARFIYGELPPTPPSNGVPDGGSSALLLGASLFGCVAVRKRLVRARP